jgi:hypothetical protein
VIRGSGNEAKANSSRSASFNPATYGKEDGRKNQGS